MAKNLKEIRKDGKAIKTLGDLDSIDIDIIALSKELEKIGIIVPKVLDCCGTFEKGIFKLVPRDVADYGVVVIHSIAHMIGMELHIKTAYMASSDYGDSALLFCYDHYRGLCVQKGLLDEKDNLKK